MNDNTEISDVMPVTRIYEIHFKDGSKQTVSGVLGINDIFVAVVDTDERLVFAAGLDEIWFCRAVPELPMSTTKHPRDGSP